MLGFPAVLANRVRLLGSSCVGLTLALACSVFPDEAVLPGSIALAGTGGQVSPPAEGGAGAAGRAQVAPSAGVATGGGGVMADGGTGGTGDTGGTGETPNSAGAGGSAEPSCPQPTQTSVDAAIDLWVDSADEKANHGEDALLYVVNGAQERRAMFQLNVPRPEVGATLLSATFSVQLASNADSSKAERRLGLHPLTRLLSESKTTWKDYTQGNKEWDTAGGDFGLRWATVTVPAETAQATLTFDVTSEVRKLQSTSALELAMVLLEIDPAPTGPAQLAITAMEGNASQSATLTLTYCEP